MKKFIKLKFIGFMLILWAVLSSGLGSGCFAQGSSNGNNLKKESSNEGFTITGDANAESGELDFIKSGKLEETVFTNNKILFYGGIFLVSASIIGIVFTVMPRSKKEKKRVSKNKRASHYSGRGVKNSKSARRD